MRSTEEIYQDLKNKYYEILKEEKKHSKIKLSLAQSLNWLILILIILFLCFIILIPTLIVNSDNMFFYVLYATFMGRDWLFISIFLLIFYILKIRSNSKKAQQENPYNLTYKKSVITELVKEVAPTLTYYPNTQLDDIYYRNYNFSSADAYYSNDTIIGDINELHDFKMSDILVETIIKSDNGSETPVRKFEGLITVIPTPIIISSQISVRSGIGSHDIMTGKLVELDSASFEKEFNVYTQDRMQAMQILTSDVMDVLLSYKKETGINLDVTFKAEFIIMRHHITNMFEVPSKFKEPISKEEIEKTINILSSIIKLNTDLNKCLIAKE